MSVADHLILIGNEGEIHYGTAQALCTQDTLSQLFNAPLMQQGNVLIPCYTSLTTTNA
jgi:ABC-type cobalamin/Fe3+-siderophores transport system ATPase subunit